VLGHRLIAGGTDAAALIRDAPGWWIPLLAAALLFALRRRAYTQETPWVVNIVAALAFVGLAAVFWRWNIMAFVAATLSGSLLLLAGLVLRRRRLSERLGRQDQQLPPPVQGHSRAVHGKHRRQGIEIQRGE
jgi:membrane associated rhomboid family serine protease